MGLRAIILFASAFALTTSACSSSSPGSTSSGGVVSGSCTYVDPPTGAPEAAECRTYENADPSAATGGSGLCPAGFGAPGPLIVNTVTSCPATLGDPPLKQLGTCTVDVPALGPVAAYTYIILYYAGQDYPTCPMAEKACANQKLTGYTATWAGIGGCS
jgi:hypothetical protein